MFPVALSDTDTAGILEGWFAQITNEHTAKSPGVEGAGNEQLNDVDSADWTYVNAIRVNLNNHGV